MARIAGMFPFRRDRGEDTELFLLLDAAQKPLHAFRIVLPGRQDDHRRQEQWQRQYRRFARRMLHRFGDRPLTELKIEAYRLGKERLRNTWPEDTDKYRKSLRGLRRQPTAQTLLLDAAYALAEGLPLPTDAAAHEKLIRRKGYREFLRTVPARLQGQAPQSGAVRITGVETAQGVLLFSETPLGRKARHSYLQHCADVYFDPRQNAGTLRLLAIDAPSAEVRALADNCIVRASRRDERSEECGLRYSQCDFSCERMLPGDSLPDAYCVEHYRMSPDFYAFDRFTKENMLLVGRKNYDIASLLYIAENGYAGHLAADYFHPFGYEGRFAALSEKIRDALEARADNPASHHDFGYEALQRQTRDIACDILAADYGIRSGRFEAEAERPEPRADVSDITPARSPGYRIPFGETAQNTGAETETLSPPPARRGPGRKSTKGHDKTIC